MKKIYKYEIKIGLYSIEIYQGAKILTVQTQYDTLCIWAIVDTKQPIVERKIQVIGTGFSLPPALGIYIGTIQLENGAFIGHVFDLGEIK